jgi:hypothetical protein
MGRSDCNIRELRVAGAREVPVRIEGMAAAPRRWIGNAHADEDIVGMAFLASGATCRWVKSAERGPHPQIDIRLSSYDDTHRDVQVGVSVGGAGMLGRCLLEREGDSFRVEPTTCSTGTIVLLTTVEGDPRTDLLALFLASSDVKFGRNRLWHLREGLVGGLAERLASLFTHGRTGQL